MPKKKVTRKELLKSQDEFITFFQRATQFSLKHRKKLLTAGAAILIVLAGAVAIKYYLDYRAEKALSEYSQLFFRIKKMQITSDQDLASVIPILEDFNKKYPRSPSGRQANIQLGAIYFQLHRYDESRKIYEGLLSSLKRGEENLRPFLLDSLAYLHEAQGNLSEAAARWEEVTRLSGVTLKEQAYLNLGRVYKQDNKPDRAREAYQRFIDNFPNSASLNLARAKLDELI